MDVEKAKDNRISELEVKNLQQTKCSRELEADMKRNANAYKTEVAKLKEKLANMIVNFEVEKVKREFFSDEKYQL